MLQAPMYSDLEDAITIGKGSEEFASIRDPL